MINPKVLDAISDVIIVFDKNSIIIDVSNSFIDVFLYSREEAIGQPIDILLPERFRKNHPEMFKSYTKNPSARRMGTGRKLFALNKNGDEFSIDIALSYYEEDGKNFYIAIVRDISDIIEYQTKLESLNKELLTRNKELDQFAFTVSHDLKAPTNTIIGLIDIIQREHEDELNNDVKQCLTHLQQTSNRMSELISGILSYSRASAGQVYVEPLRFDLKTLIQEIINNLNIAKKFKTEVNCTNIELYTNKTPLSQVLSNLIGNSIKYHDKKTGKISITCKNTTDEVTISVKDDGPGIPEKYYETIFEMFGTANVISRTDSTGIGLAIVKKLIEQNGGSINVNSTIGKGTEFVFTWKSNFVEKK
jgi:PAS domain S-box-containing protein